MKALMLVLSLAMPLFAAQTPTAAEPPSLVGLWAARRDFGPSIRGTLELVRDGNAWRAQIAGREADVAVDGANVTFALPNDEGRFRGTLAQKRIVGHWIQPRAYSFPGSMATPVTLDAVSPALYRGTVAPLDDHVALYLSIARDASGKLSGFLRNPERNIGLRNNPETITVDGERVTFTGKGGRGIAGGRYDAENDVLSMSFPWLGGTYDFTRASAADEAAFYPRGKTPAPYVYRKPLARDDGWTVASIDDVGIDRAAVTTLVNLLTSMPVESVRSSDIHALLVARHGKLVVEEYFHGASPDEPHDTRSAAKSVTDVLAGALHVDASTPVYATMTGTPNADPRKSALTLEHLLTQTSGLDCDDNDDDSPGNEDVMQNQEAQPDWYRYTLDLKSIREPGVKMVYCSCQPNLAGGVLQRVRGRWLADLFRDAVAAPLQIRRYGLWLTPTGDAYMGGGARFTPRDFLKFGQLYLDGGKWHGQQIVSADWVKHSTSPLYDFGNRKYGRLWYVEEMPYRDRKVRVVYAAGNGGQVVMIVPELDLAAAFFGGNYGDGPATMVAQNKLFPQYVLPAVK
ncbi:MAG: serine hydrolase [Acidobacteria bacterium]|nr:serine hydrolase [Acidobacteriota bacterium]MBV9477022.1 serine hydrolase [Acidobacteriota bacterium]